MKIKLNIYGPLKKYVTENKSEYEIEQAESIRQLLLKIGIPQSELVYTIVLLNKQRVRLDTPVSEGDTIDVLQPVGGG